MFGIVEIPNETNNPIRSVIIDHTGSPDIKLHLSSGSSPPGRKLTGNRTRERKFNLPVPSAVTASTLSYKSFDRPSLLNHS